MAHRTAISTRTRFEIFKRDNFTCQYCGSHPPSIVLHIDHITPVSGGGTNSRDNLVTSCDSCNLGKSNVPLSMVPQSLKDKCHDIAEREKQLKGYYKIINTKRNRIDNEIWQVVQIFTPDDSTIRRDWFQSIKRFIERLGLFEVLDAMEIAKAKHPRHHRQAWPYFCGICWNKIRSSQNGES